ncbi:MAG: hypothetical protein KDB07_06200 [Planctomycetes bacterium]|nr:hypothetical protein [Planctomycetota bacterium]
MTIAKETMAEETTTTSKYSQEDLSNLYKLFSPGEETAADLAIIEEAFDRIKDRGDLVFSYYLATSPELPCGTKLMSVTVGPMPMIFTQGQHIRDAIDKQQQAITSDVLGVDGRALLGKMFREDPGKAILHGPRMIREIIMDHMTDGVDKLTDMVAEEKGIDVAAFKAEKEPTAGEPCKHCGEVHG